MNVTTEKKKKRKQLDQNATLGSFWFHFIQFFPQRSDSKIRTTLGCRNAVENVP